jgi:hypothetical protein
MQTPDLFTEIIASIMGIFIGMLAAMAAERYRDRQHKRHRALVILRSLVKELAENHTALRAVKPAYDTTPWGKSVYLSTIGWETALAGGDLPDIIGFELADSIAAQYALLVRIRYYVDLLTRLWFAPLQAPGYDAIRQGFTQAIVETMTRAIGNHVDVMGQISRVVDSNRR